MNKGTAPSAAPQPFAFLPVAVAAAMGILLAAVVFALLKSHVETIERQRFQRDATYVATAFTASVERHVNSLAALRAFISASRNVSRWEFSTFAREALPANPGFPAFFWVPSVAAKDRARYEEDLQRDGLYGLRIRDLTGQGKLIAAGTRPLYRPVSYVEPFEGSHVAVGLDLSRLPEFEPLFATAEKTGQVAVSPPLLRSILDEEEGPSVIVAFPFVAQAAGRPQGYALGVLKFERILRAITAKGAVEIAIAYNEPAYAKKLIYSSVGIPAESRNIGEWTRKARFSQLSEFTVAGQHFILALRAPEPAAPWASLVEPLGAAALVLALAALLALHLHASITATNAVERAVVLRTLQLQRVNEALEEEIRQRRETEADLRAAKDKAEGASRAKSEFLATMSHELRTPLNAIIGFSSMLSSGLAKAERHEEYVQQIHEGGIRLLNLINDLLDLSQMDAGRIEIDEDRVHLGELAETAARKLLAKAGEASIRLHTAFSERIPVIRADERRLQKALVNLISNAIKFTPAGGEATVAIALEADGAVSLSVRDTGAGIAKGEERRILEPFVQLDSTHARNHEGAGLGLAFVKRVADLHGATLSIDSTVGQGTCVTMTIPASRVVKDAEVA